MSIAKNLQKFLTQKKLGIKIKKKSFIIKCGLEPSTFYNMQNGILHNPKLTTLAKVADVFSVSIDEMLGRDPKYYQNKSLAFHTINADSIKKNLSSVISRAMQEYHLSPHQLSKKLEISNRTLGMFMEQRINTTPGAATTLALANFLDSSIDDMIGRRPPSRMQEQKLDIPKQLSSLSKQDLEKLSDIKHSVKSSAPQDQNIKKTTYTKHLNKQKDAGRSR